MDSFHEIYRDSVQKVYKFLVRLTQNPDLAEELTSETFFQAFLHIGKFRGKCSIDTWLCQIAKNCYYKELRRRKKLGWEPEPEKVAEKQILNEDGELENRTKGSGVGSFIEEGFQKAEDREMALSLHKILHTLPEPYREVFSLRVFGELQFKEIAAIFEKSESWAKMTYYRAKAKIIEQLEVQENE